MLLIIYNNQNIGMNVKTGVDIQECASSNFGKTGEVYYIVIDMKIGVNNTSSCFELRTITINVNPPAAKPIISYTTN